MSIPLFISQSSAIEFGAYPKELNFNGKVGESICKNITLIYSGQEIEINLFDRWKNANSKGKYFEGYTLNSSELGIDLVYDHILRLNNLSFVKVCIKSNKTGKYEGILTFDVKDKPIALGVWMFSQFESKSKHDMITGSFVKLSDDKINKFLPYSLIFSTFLLIFVLFLVMQLKRKNIS